MSENKFSEKVILENLKRSPRDLTDDQIMVYIPYILKAELSFSDKIYYNRRIQQVKIITPDVAYMLRDAFFHFERIGGNRGKYYGR